MLERNFMSRIYIVLFLTGAKECCKAIKKKNHILINFSLIVRLKLSFLHLIDYPIKS